MSFPCSGSESRMLSCSAKKKSPPKAGVLEILREFVFVPLRGLFSMPLGSDSSGTVPVVAGPGSRASSHESLYKSLLLIERVSLDGIPLPTRGGSGMPLFYSSTLVSCLLALALSDQREPRLANGRPPLSSGCCFHHKGHHHHGQCNHASKEGER